MKEPSSILMFLKKIIRTISNFSKRFFSKEVLIFLIFLFISCFFWVLQSLQEISDVDLNIPITYSKVPPRISITNELPKSMRITLRDKGTNLYFYYRHRKDMAVPIDLLKYYRKDGIGKIPSTTFDSYLRNRLMTTTQLLRIQPDTISVFFVEKASKDLSIHLNSEINLAAQHMFCKAPEIFPSTIKAFAPGSVLEHLNTVETEILKVDNLGDSTILTLKLVPVSGVHFSQMTVEVHLFVEEFTEQSLMIPVTGLNFPTGEELLSFPSSVKVSFFVGLSVYHKISPKDFQVSISYTSLIQSKQSTQKLKIIKSPDKIRNLRIQPEMVDCLIEKK